MGTGSRYRDGEQTRGWGAGMRMGSRHRDMEQAWGRGAGTLSWLARGQPAPGGSRGRRGRGRRVRLLLLRIYVPHQLRREGIPGAL